MNPKAGVGRVRVGCFESAFFTGGFDYLKGWELCVHDFMINGRGFRKLVSGSGSRIGWRGLGGSGSMLISAAAVSC